MASGVIYFSVYIHWQNDRNFWRVYSLAPITTRPCDPSKRSDRGALPLSIFHRAKPGQVPIVCKGSHRLSYLKLSCAAVEHPRILNDSCKWESIGMKPRCDLVFVLVFLFLCFPFPLTSCFSSCWIQACLVPRLLGVSQYWYVMRSGPSLIWPM